jgi:hypothetical protein
MPARPPLARGRLAYHSLNADRRDEVARAHGYAGWAAFHEEFERTPRAAMPCDARAVDVDLETSRAERLRANLAAGDVDAARRVVAGLPRLREASDVRGTELQPADARVVIARERGYATWSELVTPPPKLPSEPEDGPPGPEVERAIELIIAGDADALREHVEANPWILFVNARRGESLLNLVAQPHDYGRNLRQALGVDRACVDVLIDAGSDVDVPACLAACFDRTEFLEILLDRGGVHPDATPIWGLTPLENAIFNGKPASAEILAAVALCPDTPYAAAGAGLVDALPRYFDEDGNVLASACERRADMSTIGWGPREPTDDPQEVIGDALTLAARNGRVEAVTWLLDHTSVDVDVTPWYDLSALDFAVIGNHPETVARLIERGADPLRRRGNGRTSLDEARGLDRPGQAFAAILTMLEA